MPLWYWYARTFTRIAVCFWTVTILRAAGIGLRPAVQAVQHVSDSIRKSLDQAGLKNVSVSEDPDKGIVTLGGQLASDNDKSQAESVAKSFAGALVVADQMAVIPVGGEKDAKAVNSDLDKGIGQSLDATCADDEDRPKFESAVFFQSAEPASHSSQSEWFPTGNRPGRTAIPSQNCSHA